MKKLSKLKLNVLNEQSLKAKEMDVLVGGSPPCGCSCSYEKYQGSTTSTNGSSNSAKGYFSTSGCNQYVTYGSEYYNLAGLNESDSGKNLT